MAPPLPTPKMLRTAVVLLASALLAANPAATCADRHVLIGPPGLAVPALADVEYTYLGSRTRNKLTTALIQISGSVRGLRGSGVGVGGTISGKALVVPSVGITLTSELSIRADLDMTLRRQSVQAAGTLSVKLKRLPPKPGEK